MMELKQRRTFFLVILLSIGLLVTLFLILPGNRKSERESRISYRKAGFHGVVLDCGMNESGYFLCLPGDTLQFGREGAVFEGKVHKGDSIAKQCGSAHFYIYRRGSCGNWKNRPTRY